MRVFVTGGTGALGRAAVRTLVNHGHYVTALARTPAKAAWLRDHGAHPVAVSLFDEGELARCFEGHGAVANLASALPVTWKFVFPWAWRANTRVRTLGSEAVVNAAIAAAVPRVIQESVSMIYPDRGSDWIDETVSPDTYPMAEANLAAESNNRRFTAAGGAGVVLRFGWFYGPGATHSEEFYALARRHVCIQMGQPRTYVSSIHVTDAGRAVAAALDTPAGTYNVVDDEPLTKRTYADALARAADTTAWLRVPGRAAHLLGNRTTSLTRSLRVSNRHFKDASAWSPLYPSAQEGWLATAKALRTPSHE